MTCIITGCRAIMGGKEVGGDLHLIGECYIFVAIRDRETGNAAWDYDLTKFWHYRRAVDFSMCHDLFERHGVIAADCTSCELNEEAKEYLDR